MLGVADYISYDYTEGNGDCSNLYISYFTPWGSPAATTRPRTACRGRLEHRLGRRRALTRGGEDQESHCAEGREQQVVLYWFQNRGRIIASEYWEKIYLVMDAVFKQRRGRLLSSASIGQVPKGGDKNQFTQEMLEFATRRSSSPRSSYRGVSKRV